MAAKRGASEVGLNPAARQRLKGAQRALVARARAFHRDVVRGQYTLEAPHRKRAAGDLQATISLIARWTVAPADLRLHQAATILTSLRLSLRTYDRLFFADTANIGIALALLLIKSLWNDRTKDDKGKPFDLHIDETQHPNSDGSTTTTCDIHFSSTKGDVHIPIDCIKKPEAQKVVDKLNAKFNKCNPATDDDVNALGTLTL